jgi:hypothetical protein
MYLIHTTRTLSYLRTATCSVYCSCLISLATSVFQLSVSDIHSLGSLYFLWFLIYLTVSVLYELLYIEQYDNELTLLEKTKYMLLFRHQNVGKVMT